MIESGANLKYLSPCLVPILYSTFLQLSFFSLLLRRADEFQLQNLSVKSIKNMSNEAAEFAMSKWRKLVDQLEAQSTRTKANSKKRLTNRGPFVYVDRRRYVEVQSFELLQGKTVP
ncbi:unnamed protein product [Oikopleura dioica]|uniref:Uncharacterized protein n=1 Tax=Oikopleura dioica TaxID=34765 RepID=E4X2U1_OIKDI|nr:unnamed protein product [Oikopleura dioica]